MKKRRLLVIISLLIVYFFNIVYAKYIINKKFDITIKSSPFFFEANLEKEKVVMDKTGANIKVIIRNYIESQYNTYPTEYNVTMSENNKFNFSVDSRQVTNNIINSTIDGGAIYEQTINIKLIPKEEYILNSDEHVVINVKATSPYSKEIVLPLKINTNPSTLSGMELNFLIKNGTYAPEGDVYEYYSVDANRMKDYTIKKIVFGKYEDYKDKVVGLVAEPLDVNRIGIINLYRKLNSDNTTYTIYILSEDGKFQLSDNAAWTFDKLYSLESIENLHLVDTSKVVNMRDMFCDCAVIKEIDLSNFKTSNVTNMIGLFARCHELVYLDLLSFDVSNVTEMNQAFSDCEKLKSIYVSENWKLQTGEDIDTVNLFRGATSLVGGNGTLYDEKVVNGTRAVIDGSSKGYLTSTYKFLDGPNVNHIIKAKTSAEIEAWAQTNRYTDTTIKTITFGMKRDFYNKVEGYEGVPTDSNRGGGIKTYRIPNGDGTYSVYILSNSGKFIANENSAWMFDKLAKLATINNLNLLDTGRVTNMRDMFCDCQSLTALDFSNFNVVNVTSFEGMFARMYCIEVLDLSSFNTAKATTMLNMFYAGISATDTLPEYQSVVPKLTTIYVSNMWNTSSLPEQSLFSNNINLVGGAGTVFNSSNVSKLYARVDTSTTPGYLTLK